ncbi:MAG TPA: hypothetical protein VFG10_15265 [Saprospiraceae bacterium]|nr:hypothetical protein [Saprospiraceae bacterium]
MRISLTIFIFHILGLCAAQQHRVDLDTTGSVPYNTVILKNNYKLIYSTTDNSRFLRLTGPTIDTAIMSKNIKAPKSLFGWLQQDFEDYFMMYSEYSDYSDTTVRVYRKHNGKHLFFGRFLDIDKQYNVLLFVDWKDDFKIGLFDLNTMKIELFKPPPTACNFWWDCLVSIDLMEKELIVEYATLNMKREKKVYPRQ